MRGQGLIFCWIALCAFCGYAAERPNVVLILTDDLGYGDVSKYNPDFMIHTPFMDALAAEINYYGDEVQSIREFEIK